MGTQAKLKKDLHAVVVKKAGLLKAKASLEQVAGTTSSARLQGSIPEISQVIDEIEAIQNTLEQDLGLTGPMSYTEKARTKPEKIKKALSSKQDEIHNTNARLKEYQDVLKPLEVETDKLNKDCIKTQQEYDAALCGLAGEAKKNKLQNSGLMVPIGHVGTILGWMNALEGGEPGETCATTYPDVHTIWLADNDKSDAACMTPMTWASAFINTVVRTIATNARAAGSPPGQQSQPTLQMQTPPDNTVASQKPP